MKQKMNKTPQELLKEKQNMLYGVKGFNSKKEPETDVSERTVSLVGNTYYYADSYLDVLVSGAAKKTISDNGPGSNAEEKINHIADHKLDTEHLIGRFTELSETQYEHPQYGTLTGIVGNSFIPDTQKGNEYLLNYKNKMYNQHSIGFIYRDLQLADKQSSNETERLLYEEYYPQIINKELVDQYGFFFVVKEIELWEISTVMRGANTLTATLGVKSDSPETTLMELFNRLNILEGQYKAKSFGSKKNLELQIRQIKQMMNEIVTTQKPHVKGTETPPNNSVFTKEQMDSLLEIF